MTNIEIKTRSIMDSLNNSEKKVATYFLNNIMNIFSTPISKLAEEADVSQVTWIRFCKAIGFDGLKDLKKSLFNELNSQASDTTDSLCFADIRKDSTIEMMCTTIKNAAIQAVDDTIKLINIDDFTAIIDLISKANSIRLFGVGASAQVADDFYKKLIRINKNTIFSFDMHTQLTYGATIGPKDVAIIFSYTGTTKEMLEIRSLTQRAKCPTVAVTKYTKSPLVATADHVIYLSAPEIDQRSGATSSRIAQLTVVDLLFICLANKHYAKVEKYLELSSEVCRSHRS